jgi:alkylhydroperoxidase family enzyme
MNAQQQGKLVNDLFIAIIADVRNAVALRYTKICDCESCIAMREEIAERSVDTKMDVEKAMDAFRKSIEETDPQCLVVASVGDFKKIVHDLADTLDKASKN